MSREGGGPVRTVGPEGRSRIRCFATSTIRERVGNACYNFILLQSRRILSSPRILESPRKTRSVCIFHPPAPQLPNREPPVLVRRSPFTPIRGRIRSRKLLFRKLFYFRARLLSCATSKKPSYTRSRFCVITRRDNMRRNVCTRAADRDRVALERQNTLRV